jgi:hypothetical protein
MGKKGSHAPPMAIPRTAQMPPSFPAETSMLLEAVRQSGISDMRWRHTFQQKPGVAVHAKNTSDELVTGHTRQFPDDILRRII